MSSSHNSFRIQIVSQKWLSESENDERDLCSHGEISLTASGTKITAPGNNYTISTSALLLLRSALSDHDWDHPVGHDALLVLCCGMIHMTSCPIGIYWSVRHEGGTTFLGDFRRWDTTSRSDVHRFPDVVVQLPTIQYRRVASEFAVKAKHLFSGVAKIPFDEHEAKLYTDFWSEYNTLLDRCIG